MKTPTISLKRKRLFRKANECLRLINVGNTKIQDTLHDLSPMITTDELNKIYTSLNQIMHLQCTAYRVLLSEKEEE